VADDINLHPVLKALLNSYEADSLQYFKITILFQKAVMKIIGVFVVLFFAMVEDVQSRIIRNVWVIAIFIVHLALSWEKGPGAAVLYVAKTGLWLLALLVLYLLGVVGAGDVKLISVLASGLQEAELFWFWTASLVCAGLMAVFKVLMKERRAIVPLALPMWFGYVTVLIHKGGVYI
jgi:prepilin peptidase CpaA